MQSRWLALCRALALDDQSDVIFSFIGPAALPCPRAWRWRVGSPVFKEIGQRSGRYAKPRLGTVADIDGDELAGFDPRNHAIGIDAQLVGDFGRCHPLIIARRFHLRHCVALAARRRPLPAVARWERCFAQVPFWGNDVDKR